MNKLEGPISEAYLSSPAMEAKVHVSKQQCSWRGPGWCTMLSSSILGCCKSSESVRGFFCRITTTSNEQMT